MLEQVKALGQLGGKEHLLDKQRKLIWVCCGLHAVERLLVASKVYTLKS